MAIDCEIPQFYPASWRGVPFVVEKSEDKFGRRGDIYEYALSNNVAHKDLGRKARRFKVEGWLLGGNQVQLTQEMSQAAEAPEPATLVHPIFGEQTVACIEVKFKVDYIKEIRQTKLEFEFVEAAQSLAPYVIGSNVNNLFTVNWAAIIAAIRQAVWIITASVNDQAETQRITRSLASLISPAVDEESFDAIDRLERAPYDYRTFRSIAGAIVEGTATIRRIHDDAVERLRSWNASLAAPAGSPSVESLILLARLAIGRDLGLAVAQNTYRTVRDALADLDFLMKIFDEEEQIAVYRCADELTLAIREARAETARQVLDANIRLPGVVTREVHGTWPSLVVAHKLYGDGRRYADVEAYNPDMNPLFMGRTVVAPAA